MKERNELARAMTELPDDLLLEAAQTPRRRKPMTLCRAAAVAAVITMLAVTVCAAAVGITWTVDKEPGEALVQRFGTIALDYYKDYDGTQSFEKLELTLPLEKVEVKEESFRGLRTQANRRWDLSQRKDRIVVGFWSLADLEELLGIELALPDQVRTAIRKGAERYGEQPLLLSIYTEPEDTQKYVKLVIDYQLDGYCTNGTVNGSITIPLTEEAAQQGMLVECYSYEKEGPIWQEEQTIGGRTFTIFGNDPEAGYNGWCMAAYTEGGIGYTIDAYRYKDIPYYIPDYPHYDCAKDMLLPLLQAEK